MFALLTHLHCLHTLLTRLAYTRLPCTHIDRTNMIQKMDSIRDHRVEHRVVNKNLLLVQLVKDSRYHPMSMRVSERASTDHHPSHLSKLRGRKCRVRIRLVPAIPVVGSDLATTLARSNHLLARALDEPYSDLAVMIWRLIPTQITVVSIKTPFPSYTRTCSSVTSPA